MWEFTRKRPITTAIGIVVVLGIVSLALLYFIPTPPSRVVIATAFKGASFEYFGLRYKDIFARSKVRLDLRETEGAVENLRLLQDPNAGVQIGFVAGGVSDGTHSPGLLSMGTVDYLPIWVFYVAPEPIERLTQLQGKRIAVGPAGSGTRVLAERILGKAGVTSERATLVPLAGRDAMDALVNGTVDIAWVQGAAETAAVQGLLRDPRVRLMSFPTAEAYTRLFPSLARLVLPQGVIDIERNIPPTDIQLVATTVSVLVRSDLNPAIVTLLLQAMSEVHDEPGLLHGAREFPRSFDSDYPLAGSAADFYKNGPSLMQRYLPLWLIVHAERAVALLVAGVALGLPLLHFLPMLYKWNVRRRLLYWYEQLKLLEAAIDADPGGAHMAERLLEIERIESTVSRIRIPLAFTDQLYDLRGHIEIVRRRFASRPIATDHPPSVEKARSGF